MSETGEIGWVDLTVPDAKVVRDFYAAVAGWESKDHDMGGYADYEMLDPASGKCVAGICHARGPNEGIPAQWMVYIPVTDIEASIAACTERGGSVVAPVRAMGEHGRIGIIRDPAGAVCALWQKGGA